MDQLNLIIKAVNDSVAVEKIILFGSYATKKANNNSDLDIAVIEKDTPKLGQKAKIWQRLSKLGFNWEIDPDIHLFSKQDFNTRLSQNDLFIQEILKGEEIQNGN